MTWKTVDWSATLPHSDRGGGNRVFKYWRWNGTDFSLARTAGLSH